ncbi:protein abrupt [Culicoides brevitarsis]|uniref:protein abrupt n=1 Tax=Culicoides brevitarsis TaxID=469753 RepID=UPI00307CC31C
MERNAASPAPSEQQYALKWNDFQSSILSSFRHLRDEEDFVDVTLACDQRSFTAHKVVLSACSPYFRKLLKANPCEHPIVILRDIRPEDVESLLRFMYNGEVHIGQEQLPDFLKTAQLLQVRGLADVANPARLSSTTLHPTPLPVSQDLKVSSSNSMSTWDMQDDNSASNPPPQKRTKSSELFKKQHGFSPERLLPAINPPLQQHALTRERRSKSDQESRDRKEDRDRSMEFKDSLLGQALEGGPTLIVPSQTHADLSSLQAQSAGEDSNASDDAGSDRDDDQMDGMNGSMDPRTSSFPGFLGLQGIPGFPGPSGMHGDNFVNRRTLEMRVRATDPRPCPKCGKIYRSAHTLRTHLEDKHTVCPGYRCVLCGTVAKSRNSLHSHMSRQHRGISTKDLPVLPMPSPFDPELASRLLAKAGVKISAAELRARASPTGTSSRPNMKLDMRGEDGDTDNDPEDLTMSGHGPASGNGRYSDQFGLSPTAFSHPNTTITRVRSGALTPKSLEQLSKDGGNAAMGGHGGPTGSALLDTYLQFITENSFGMGMSQDQAMAAFHAAKMAQLNAMGHGLDKLPPGLLPPQIDIAKVNNNRDTSPNSFLSKIQSNTSVTIEPANNNSSKIHGGMDIKRDSEPMDLGHEQDRNERERHQEEINSSGDERNYSDDESGQAAVAAN